MDKLLSLTEEELLLINKLIKITRDEYKSIQSFFQFYDMKSNDQEKYTKLVSNFNKKIKKRNELLNEVSKDRTVLLRLMSIFQEFLKEKRENPYLSDNFDLDRLDENEDNLYNDDFINLISSEKDGIIINQIFSLLENIFLNQEIYIDHLPINNIIELIQQYGSEYLDNFFYHDIFKSIDNGIATENYGYKKEIENIAEKIKICILNKSIVLLFDKLEKLLNSDEIKKYDIDIIKLARNNCVFSFPYILNDFFEFEYPSEISTNFNFEEYIYTLNVNQIIWQEVTDNIGNYICSKQICAINDYNLNQDISSKTVALLRELYFIIGLEFLNEDSIKYISSLLNTFQNGDFDIEDSSPNKEYIESISKAIQKVNSKTKE